MKALISLLMSLTIVTTTSAQSLDPIASVAPIIEGPQIRVLKLGQKAPFAGVLASEFRFRQMKIDIEERDYYKSETDFLRKQRAEYQSPIVEEALIFGSGFIVGILTLLLVRGK